MERQSEAAALRLQVRVLAAGLGLEYADEIEAVPQEVRDLALAGQSVKAVRILRRRGVSLIAAKRIVDAIAADGGSASG